MKTKTCRACHMPRPIERFYVCADNPDRLQNTCKACLVVKQRAFHQSQRSGIEAMRQAWRISDGDRFTNLGMREVPASFAAGLASVIDQIGQYQARRAAPVAERSHPPR